MGNSVIIISGSQPFTQDRIDQKIRLNQQPPSTTRSRGRSEGGVAVLMGSFLAVLAFEVGAIESANLANTNSKDRAKAILKWQYQ